MKIGVKTYYEKKFLEHFKDSADFFEIMAIEKYDYDFLKKFNKEFVIHAQHGFFGINNADKKIYEKNLSSINYAIKLADMTNSKKIIVHPGDLSNEFSSIDNAIEFFNNINDKRILIENMTGNKNYKRLCETPDEIKEFIKKTKTGLCLDFNHAILKAFSIKTDYMDFIKDFLKLKPKHYHIGGQSISKDKDHICLRDSDFDFLNKIMKIIPKDAEISLETETDIKKIEDDLKIIKNLIR